MSMKDGGPAFPIPDQQFSDGVTIVPAQGSPGMSLRDWFAGQALAGLLAAGSETSWEIDAVQAYRAADAMLAEREQRDDHG